MITNKDLIDNNKFFLIAQSNTYELDSMYVKGRTMENIMISMKLVLIITITLCLKCLGIGALVIILKMK